MTNKQSSVEYYIVNLINILGDEICNKITIEQNNKIVILEKQAKAMHKEEVINSILDNRNITSQVTFKDAEQYYTKTFIGNHE